MHTNYNFKENWYNIIVPLLNTPKVKNAIKKGILGYMNNSLNNNVKFKSYKNIFDHLNNIQGNCYLNINSSPSDYSSRCTEHQTEFEENLIDKLEKDGILKKDDFVYTDDDEANDINYEKYRKYLEPILEPYINNYKKTHIDSYCLWGGCHWWNPTFCLTLANIVMPNEQWRVQSNDYHTTIVNSDNTKIFDILYFDEDDESFGGNHAFENSSMTLDEIKKRNDKENEQRMNDKVNNCMNNEIYNPTFNQLNTELDEIGSNINKMEKTLEELYGFVLNKTFNDEEKDFKIFEFQLKIIDELFPNAKFDVSIDFNDLNKVITTKKEIKLIQDFKCYCYELYPKSDKTFIIKSDKPMTIRYIINELIKQDFKLECNHRFLEFLEVNDKGIVEYCTGS